MIPVRPIHVRMVEPAAVALEVLFAPVLHYTLVITVTRATCKVRDLKMYKLANVHLLQKKVKASRSTIREQRMLKFRSTTFGR